MIEGAIRRDDDAPRCPFPTALHLLKFGIVMSATNDTPAPSNEAQALRRMLMKIADILQCPVSDLYASDLDAALDDVTELVRLWNATADRQGRQRILVVARQEAARSAAEISAPLPVGG